MLGSILLSPFLAIRAFKYRDRAEIINDILKSIRESRWGRKKTQIMQTANLNHIQMNKYLRYLVSRGFLELTDKGNIVITEKGTRFLQFLEVQRTQVIA